MNIIAVNVERVVNKVVAPAICVFGIIGNLLLNIRLCVLLSLSLSCCPCLSVFFSVLLSILLSVLLCISVLVCLSQSCCLCFFVSVLLFVFFYVRLCPCLSACPTVCVPPCLCFSMFGTRCVPCCYVRLCLSSSVWDWSVYLESSATCWTWSYWPARDCSVRWIEWRSRHTLDSSHWPSPIWCSAILFKYSLFLWGPRANHLSNIRLMKTSTKYYPGMW